MTAREPQPKREPRPLAELVGLYANGRGWGEHLALGRLRNQWASVVGESVASRSEPFKLSGGVLTIRAETGTWATELTLLGRSLAQRADQALGGGVVREVRVVSSGGFHRPPAGS
ncbi:MAG: DciA family protein [Actinomycetota bacterium]|nr:DUF721 domain-containing protein [Actinomycetota bacterium]